MEARGATLTVRQRNSTGVRPGANSISASPVPRRLGSTPSPRPVNAGRARAGASGQAFGARLPSSFAFHICLTDVRAIRCPRDTPNTAKEEAECFARLSFRLVTVPCSGPHCGRPMEPIRRAPSTQRTTTPFARRPRSGGLLNPRDWWWWLLDLFEASRAARVVLYLAATAVVAGGALWFWAYPAWNKRNAVRIARQWMASGHLRYAAEAAQNAAAADPTNPEPWLIAAELARLGGQKETALNYARRAAELAPA